MKKYVVTLVMCMVLGILATGCAGNVRDQTENQSSTEEGTGEYMKITAEEAKKIMDSEEDYVILDVREPDEYEGGHVPGAVQLSVNEIDTRAESVLTDKEQQILVYCRSGRRSALAADKLLKLGYANVKDFGGINDWPYEVE